MTIHLNPDQDRILNWRITSGGVAGIVGPPGCGKTTTGSALAIKMIADGNAKKVLLVAFTNSAANEFCREVSIILGPTASKFLCVRSGYLAGIDTSLPIPFSNNIEEIRTKKIVICTTLSLWRLSGVIKFDNMIIDEAGIEKLQDILSPFTFGINQMAVHLLKNKISYAVNNIIELAANCGIIATVVGDPKQSRPIGLADYDHSAIEYVIKYANSDTLFTTHRLPDTLSALVNEFANYNGLKSAPDVALRRLNLNVSNISPEFKNVILPEEVVTWIDVDNGNEEMSGPSSWYNEKEAITCSKICNELTKVAPNKSIVVVTRYTEQRRIIANHLRRLGLENIRVLTTTGALGTQSDIVLFSIVRNNPERQVGAVGSLQDLNVAISRSKEKLFIIGSFDMMMNGWSKVPNLIEKGRKSISRRLAYLIDHKYGRIIQAPSILIN